MIQNSYSVKVQYENRKINIKTINEATMLFKEETASQANVVIKQD